MRSVGKEWQEGTTQASKNAIHKRTRQSAKQSANSTNKQPRKEKKGKLAVCTRVSVRRVVVRALVNQMKCNTKKHSGSHLASWTLSVS